MTHLEISFARRTVIKGAGIGLIAGTLPVSAQTPAAAPDAGSIWSGEYWAKKGDVPLWMFRKRHGAPKAGEPARPVVLLVHGSSLTTHVFVHPVPGHLENSVL